MANKCAACGRFLTATDGAKCNKCGCFFHRACIGVGETGKISAAWLCPGCKTKKPKGDNSDTPVKSLHSEVLKDEIVRESVKAASPSKESIDLMEEMRAFRAEVKCEFAAVRKEMEQLRAVLREQSTRLESLDARVTNLESVRTVPGSADIVKLEAAVEELKNELNNRDQALLADEVEIIGIPEVDGENLGHTVGLLMQKLGMKVEDTDVVSVSRVGARRGGVTEGQAASESSRSRPVAVKFSRRQLRDDVMRSARVRRNLTTKDLEIPRPASRFYVNERLTKFNKRLHYKARELAGAAGWRYVWAKGGRIFVRRDSGGQIFRVRTAADLDRVLGDHTPSTETFTAE